MVYFTNFSLTVTASTCTSISFRGVHYGTVYLQNRMISAVSLRLLVLLEAQIYHNFYRSVDLKFHWDQFPSNFPVENVTGKSPTSYEVVERVASLLPRSYEEVGDFQTISTCQDGLATSPTSS